jgi:dimethylglycine dehydrogenase
MSYAGELGWEFHILRDAALAVYDAHWTAGEGHGIADYGSFAMNALRTEKGFKGAGELTNEVTQPEADVMRSARLDKDYLGAEQTRVSAAADLPCVCAYLEIEPKGVDDDHGGEAAIVAGTVIGSTASVAFGHSVGQVLAFAYIKPHADHPGTDVQVVIAGETRSGRILGAPAYDPDSKRPRADVAMEVAE